MKYILRPFYWIYQYLIAWPILVLLTAFTAFFTICTVRWRNAEWVHKEQQFWSRSFFWLMFLPVSVDGEEHIQPGQSYVFVSNHQSMFDVWLVYGWLPVIFKWLMKAELRKVPFIGSGCKAAGHIFVERRNAKAALASLKEVEKQRDGKCTAGRDHSYGVTVPYHDHDKGRDHAEEPQRNDNITYHCFIRVEKSMPNPVCIPNCVVDKRGTLVQTEHTSIHAKQDMKD